LEKQALLEEVRRVKPDRVVFDSLSEMRMLAESPLRYRRQILGLKQYFAGRKCTVLLLDDRTAELLEAAVPARTRKRSEFIRQAIAKIGEDPGGRHADGAAGRQRGRVSIA
jgi:hypothetical protein